MGKRRFFLIVMLGFIFLNLNFVVAEEFGYNLLEAGKGLNPSQNLSLITVNASEIWITNQGNLDNIPDLYPTTDNRYLYLNGSNANQLVNISPEDFQSSHITTDGITGVDGNLVIDSDSGEIQLKPDSNAGRGLRIFETSSKLNLANSGSGEIYFQDSLFPSSSNVYDLGGSSNQWKDLYVTGVGYFDEIEVDINITEDGTKLINKYLLRNGSNADPTVYLNDLNMQEGNIEDVSEIDVSRIKDQNLITILNLDNGVLNDLLENSAIDFGDVNNGYFYFLTSYFNDLFVTGATEMQGDVDLTGGDLDMYGNDIELQTGEIYGNNVTIDSDTNMTFNVGYNGNIDIGGHVNSLTSEIGGQWLSFWTKIPDSYAGAGYGRALSGVRNSSQRIAGHYVSGSGVPHEANSFYYLWEEDSYPSVRVRRALDTPEVKFKKADSTGTLMIGDNDENLGSLMIPIQSLNTNFHSNFYIQSGNYTQPTSIAEMGVNGVYCCGYNTRLDIYTTDTTSRYQTATFGYDNGIGFNTEETEISYVFNITNSNIAVINNSGAYIENNLEVEKNFTADTGYIRNNVYYDTISNESKTATQGSITNVNTCLDDTYYNITEVTGADAIITNFTFTNVDSFRNIVFCHRYTGTHDLHISIWNKDLSKFIEINDIGNTDVQNCNYKSVGGNYDALIDSGTVKVEIRHPQSGNVNHLEIIDCLRLER